MRTSMYLIQSNTSYEWHHKKNLLKREVDQKGKYPDEGCTVRAFMYYKRYFSSNNRTTPGAPKRPTTMALNQLIPRDRPTRLPAKFRKNNATKPTKALISSFPASLMGAVRSLRIKTTAKTAMSMIPMSSKYVTFLS